MVILKASRPSFGDSPNSRYSQGSQTMLKHAKRSKSPIPLRLKSNYKLSNPTATSPKRSHGNDHFSDRPSKLQKVSSKPDAPKPSGLEECGVLSEISDKKPTTRIAKTYNETYLHRRKLAIVAANIKRRRITSCRVSASWNNLPSKAQQGMANFTGVLCYRNSLLQAILHCPKINNWLLKFHSPELCMHDSSDLSPCVACDMYNLAKSYWSGHSSSLLLASKRIHQNFRKNNWTSGSASGQADPDEQLTWLVSKLRSQLPAQIFSIFESLNHPLLNSSTHCPSCNHRTINPPESEGSFSIELQPRIRGGTLTQYIAKYLAYTVNDYKCDSCSATGIKTRTRLLSYSPDVLLVQLKRFDPFGKKDKYPVGIEPLLDLNSYRSEGNTRESVYRVAAVVEHTGTLTFGHYRCTARGPDGKWLVFNDTDVTKCSEKEALSSGTGQGFTPYLLFFHRLTKSYK